LLFSFIAGISTTLGALVVYAMGKAPKAEHMSFSLSLAAGVMISVSILEFWIPALIEGKNFLKFCISTAAGALCFVLIEQFLPEQEQAGESFLPGDSLNNEESQQLNNTNTTNNGKKTTPDHKFEVESTKEDDAASNQSTKSKASKVRLAILMMMVLTAHNFPEGLAVAISTADNMRTGVVICGAIALHNIPEGIAIAVPYFDADGDRRKAVMMALLSGLTEPIGALVALLVLKPILNHDVMETILIFVGGIMVCVALFELIPASIKYRCMTAHSLGLVSGIGIMCVAHFASAGQV